MQRCQFAPVTAAISLCLLFAVSEAHAQAHTKGRKVEPLTETVKAGDYTWHPEVSPSGPVIVLVSLPDQLLYVYRNGVRIGRSTVSTGKAGKRTPTGCSRFCKRKSIMYQAFTKVPRCRICSGSPGLVSRCTPGICRATRHPLAV